MAKKDFKEIDVPFNQLDVDKQIQWLIKHSEQVISKLPQLKKALAIYDDKSNEMYNMEPNEIRLFAQSYAYDLTTGDTSSSDTGLQNFVGQLEKYSGNIMELRMQAMEERIQSFKDSIVESGASENEIEYVNSLLDKMTDEQKEAFTKSKLFLDTHDYPSEGIQKFMDMYDFTPQTAKLEDWCQQHDIKTDDWYGFED